MLLGHGGKPERQVEEGDPNDDKENTPILSTRSTTSAVPAAPMTQPAAGQIQHKMSFDCLWQAGWYVEVIDGDGSCLYSAFKDQLGDDDVGLKSTSTELRAKVVSDLVCVFNICAG
eukprot:GHVU01172891.1.p4 GENE.GHVU01172891.1~~GHVU01172891.1.p4  ORF type:complete len:116 (-),score=11.85 GHVU01172891.1:1564-1911(-)